MPRDPTHPHAPKQHVHGHVRHRFAPLVIGEDVFAIEASLGANTSKLYAMGFRHAPHRSTLADGNESHNWRI